MITDAAFRSAQRRGCLLTCSLGYEHHTPDSFFAELHVLGAEVLADVRGMTWGRYVKRGFDRESLAQRCQAEGIQYAPFRELGIPAEIRNRLLGTRQKKTATDYEKLFEWYDYQLTAVVPTLARLRALCQTRTVCLVCKEADPACCHRSRILRVL